MAGRDSFQKRQKEAARREKRQSKLDRRQGRQPAHSENPGTTEEAGTETWTGSPDNAIPAGAGILPGEPPNSPPQPPNDRPLNLFKPGLVESEQPQTDNPHREP